MYFTGTILYTLLRAITCKKAQKHLPLTYTHQNERAKTLTQSPTNKSYPEVIRKLYLIGTRYHLWISGWFSCGSEAEVDFLIFRNL